MPLPRLIVGTLFLFLHLPCGTALAAACVPSSVSSATLEIAGDDRYWAYLNGVTLTSCTLNGGGCYKNYATIVVPPSAINLPPAENVLAVYATDIGGQVSGVSWRLTINYVGCPAQTVVSDGSCTRARYAGNVFGTSGTPPVTFPPGWTGAAYDDSAWGGPWSSDPCAVACTTCCDNWNLSLGLPWMWGGQTYLTAYQSDGFLFRQHFLAGDPSYCGFTPPPTPTVIGTITPGTVTPVPAGTNTFTRTPTPTPSPTATRTPSSTPSPSPSSTPTRTPTATPSATPTQSPSATATLTRTATATPSDSPSPSATPSVTLTRTETSTPTASPTSSPSSSSTPTRTPTSTPSETPSPSDTRTVTLTRTPTETRTDSPTQTASLSPTPSRTPTSTPSQTPSPSDTWTVTLTRTPTETRTDSPTQTVSLTPTPSRSPTATPSSTRSATPSSSATPTATESATTSATPTATPTATQSATTSATPTATPTATQSVTTSATPTATPTATQSATTTATPTGTPSATTSATPSVTPTSTPSLSSSPTRTATLSSSPTLTWSATGSPTRTASATPSRTASPSATRTLTASPSATPTLSWTPSASVTSTPTATTSRTASASVTVTLSFTPSPTVTPTGTPAPPLRAQVQVYNAAGERVALLDPSLGLYAWPSGLAALNGAVVPGSGAPALFSLGAGLPTLSWDGMNSSGQAVDSGSYHLVLQVTDAFGAVQSFRQSVSVLAAPGPLRLLVFNAAGESVASLAVPPGADPSRLSASQDSLVAGKGSLGIQVGNGRQGSLSWDGRNSLGQPVASGTYRLLLFAPGDPTRAVQSLAVQVLAAPEALPALVFGPHPLRRGQALRVQLPGAQGLLQLRIYNLAGELIGEAQGPAGGFEWPLTGKAGGVYLLRPVWIDGGLRRPLPPAKMALVF